MRVGMRNMTPSRAPEYHRLPLATRTPSHTRLPPIDGSVIRRLAPSSSLPSILSADVLSNGPGKPRSDQMLHHSQILRSSSSQDQLTEAKQLRRMLTQKVAEGATLGVQMQRRRKMTIRQKATAEAEVRIRKHRERLVEATESLSDEQEEALAACFNALEAENPVSQFSRVPGTINLDELPLALRSFGYSPADEAEIVELARQDLEAKEDIEETGMRLDVEEFLRCFRKGPKPVEITRHLTSIGKLIEAVRGEESEQETDHAAGQHLVMSDTGRRITEKRLQTLDHLATEAYPFSILTDAHRISALIQSYHVPLSPPPQPKPRRTAKGVSKDGVHMSTFKNDDQLKQWLLVNRIDTSQWGLDGAKTVADLFNEIEKREAMLKVSDGKVVIVRSVIRLVVRESPGALRSGLGTYRHLVCMRQKLGDGRMRERNQLPSEKIYDGEEPMAAASRVAIDELGKSTLDKATIKLFPESLIEWSETTPSLNFPHLLAQHLFYQVDTLIRGLPMEPFSSMEGKKEYFWEWRTDAPDDVRRKPPAADEGSATASPSSFSQILEST